MKNFVLITNVYKDKNLKLSNEIVSYIKEHGGKGKILLSNVENETGDEFETKDIPDDT